MWIEVDFPTFADARKLAEPSGSLIRPDDPGALEFLVSQRAEPADLFVPVPGADLRRAAMLGVGLYRGAFRYSLGPDRAFVWAPDAARARPLRRWGARETVDVAVSYSSEDRDALAIPLVEGLRSEGVEVYAVDVAEAPDDPLWRLRYREGLMHSRYFVPVLSPRYLAREGTKVELADMELMTAEHRATEHFYPLLPWRPSSQSPEDVRREWSARGNSEEAGWLLSHVFPLPSNWDVPTMAAFLRSLSRTARSLERGHPSDETEYLRLLRPFVSSAETPPRETKWASKVTLRHEWWEGRHYEFYLKDTGRMTWLGVGEFEGAGNGSGFDELLRALAANAGRAVEVAPEASTQAPAVTSADAAVPERAPDRTPAPAGGDEAADAFGFVPATARFAILPERGLALVGGCRGVKDYFELGGQLATAERFEDAVAVMECCVNAASALSVKGRALYLAAKVAIAIGNADGKAAHYARLAASLFPEEPSIRALKDRLGCR